MGTISVDAPPATGWDIAGPADGLAPDLWATGRPTDRTVADLDLPAGTLVHGEDGQLIGWQAIQPTDVDLPGLWLRCARQFPTTGLWPVFTYWPLQPTRGWPPPGDDGSPNPYTVPSDAFDAFTSSVRGWAEDDYTAVARELLDEHGLAHVDTTAAKPSAVPTDPLSLLVEPRPVEANPLTLVACRRPSDAVLLLDFGIPNEGVTPGILTGMLRSWETRFALVPVQLNPAWTAFQVLAPPTDQDQIDHLAAEVVLFADDSADQGGLHIRDLGRAVTAQEMVRSREWLIWWD